MAYNDTDRVAPPAVTVSVSTLVIAASPDGASGSRPVGTASSSRASTAKASGVPWIGT